MVDLRKLLPSNQRGTASEDIVKATQEVLQDFLTENENRLRGSANLAYMSESEAINYIERFGYNLFPGDGYSSTPEYYLKEVENLVKRLKTKTANPTYQYIMSIYNLKGYTYPLLVDSDDLLEPWLDWLTFAYLDETEAFHLDEGYLDDGTNPVFPIDPARALDEDVDDFGVAIPTVTGPLNLDDPSAVYGTLVRHILVSYEPIAKVSNGMQVLELSDQVMRSETAKSFYENVIQFKRLVEVAHFEYRLKIKVTTAGTTLLSDYITETGDLWTNPQIARLFTGRDLINVAKVQFGSGAQTQTNITAESITGCAIPIDTAPYGVPTDGSPNFRSDKLDYNKVEQSSIQCAFRNYIGAAMKWFNFTEICLFDSSNNVICYATFPQVVFHPSMFSSIYVEVNKQ
jgi:hypothetical protein